MFPKDTYVNRRQQLMADVNDGGLILLLGNEESSKNYKDNTYRFRQDSNFLYFLGWDQPHLAAVIDPESGETTLYGDDLSVDHIVWMGPQPGMREMADRVGAKQTAPYKSLADTLANAAASGRKIHYLPPYRAENLLKISRWLGQTPDAVENGHSVPLVKAIIKQASYKSAEEIAEIEKAVTISGQMHVAAMRSARAGIREAELTGIVEGIAIGAGGDVAYPVILTINGQTLHNHYHGNVLQSGQMVLGDFGAETATHYAGDITRTFPVDTKFTARQKDIYELVLQAELESINALKPGIPYRDIHLQAARIMADGLKDLGLMKGDMEAAVAEGAHAMFFPHGLGHMMGLDVHDMEDLGEDYVGYTDTIRRSPQFGLSALRLGRELEAGFVLTVEPGLYFIPELIDQWQAAGKFKDFINYDKVAEYRDFSGVRIEDNVLITEDGHRVLGAPIPKTVDEVEAVRNGG
ncbi:aminopeptidase P family protein [Flavilitoribacter nigricans]|uniref:Xaa-Pro aminopeptidase n=1 Tax=Flavilitoribacter nigricans (strain ATCC 23147 / DSM 23189 / NBRC 102662 / NCIMB 1420 / SS-2) TaxID=1122177 RepID=A0A2D0N2I7_FLAN2|nr:aminopeptidase P family protein [Flavilitoribacter nigricans]PHN02667.1 Xaa-Pro aminopeptidase [Flavilitoribacter nigricans DSM 23189 = NBRC 102662]